LAMQNELSKRQLLIRAFNDVVELLLVMKMAGLDTRNIESDAIRIARRLAELNERLENELDQDS
jgi:hypothetical protein